MSMMEKRLEGRLGPQVGDLLGVQVRGNGDPHLRPGNGEVV